MDIGGELATGLGISAAITIVLLGLRFWLPKVGAQRVAEKGTLIGPATRPSYEDQVARRTGADLQYLANRRLHDEMLVEAVKLKIRARTGSAEERLASIDRAVEKTHDALTARPESYEGTKLLGELHLDRALINQDLESVADLEQAAQLFQKASSFRLGVIDNYVGRGWSYLQMSNVDPDFGHVYAEKAAAAFAAGFERSQMNVWIMRGWGLAIDHMARAPDHDPAKLAEHEAAYREALGQHRDGNHELFDWYGAIRRASEPAWLEVPTLRDVY